MPRPRSAADSPANDARRLFEAGWSRERLAELTGASVRTVETWTRLSNPRTPSSGARILLARAWARESRRPR